MIFQILESKAGAGLGTVEASDAYSAAREACRRFFKSPLLPFRETDWAGQSGTFAVQEESGARGRRFYVRVPT
ncbi:MAG: hypothetical protein KGL39_35915 [Patescibacteria group bacterium]|nr:hypothetical protein [Patescibacteria group bacterium]